MSKLRVLYVDDEPDIREVAQLSLALDPDIEVKTAESGPIALALLAGSDWRPDVVLLDFMMPGMDGPTMLAKMRAEPKTANLPVIFMTARVQASERNGLLKLGALAAISKPFDPMSLAAELRALVRGL